MPETEEPPFEALEINFHTPERDEGWARETMLSVRCAIFFCRKDYEVAKEMVAECLEDDEKGNTLADIIDRVEEDIEHLQALVDVMKCAHARWMYLLGELDPDDPGESAPETGGAKTATETEAHRMPDPQKIIDLIQRRAA